MQIYQFGMTTLPASAPTWEDSPQADMRTLATLGGHFNAYRGDRAPFRFPRPLTVSALAYSATQSALGVSIDGLRSQIGVRDRLWGKPYDTTQVDRWCWATLRQVIDRGTYNQRIYQRVELIFDVESHWNGHAYSGAWNLDAGYLFDNGLYFDSAATTYYPPFTDQNLVNAGNRMVTNAGITYTCNTGAGTALVTITTQNCAFTVGPLVDTDVLVLDCGSRTVTVNGADAYSRFMLTANHGSPYWLEIAAGGENVSVTGGGGTDTIVFTYSDGWY